LSIGVVYFSGCGGNDNPAGGGNNTITHDSRLVTGAGEVWEMKETCSTYVDGSISCSRGDYVFFADGTFWTVARDVSKKVGSKYMVSTWCTKGDSISYMYAVGYAYYKYSVSGNNLRIYKANGYDYASFEKKTGITILDSWDDVIEYNCRNDPEYRRDNPICLHY